MTAHIKLLSPLPNTGHSKIPTVFSYRKIADCSLTNKHKESSLIVLITDKGLMCLVVLAHNTHESFAFIKRMFLFTFMQMCPYLHSNGKPSNKTARGETRLCWKTADKLQNGHATQPCHLLDSNDKQRIKSFQKLFTWQRFMRVTEHGCFIDEFQQLVFLTWQIWYIKCHISQ